MEVNVCIIHSRSWHQGISDLILFDITWGPDDQSLFAKWINSEQEGWARGPGQLNEELDSIWIISIPCDNGKPQYACSTDTMIVKNLWFIYDTAAIGDFLFLYINVGIEFV